MTKNSSSSLSYRAAGVDMDAGHKLVEQIAPLAKRTMREGVLTGLGGFGALFEVPKNYFEPVLVSGTDGVGTKLKLAFQLGRHEGIGQDLVAMSVNDILVQGAEPLFFLDYFACGSLDVQVGTTVIGGVAHGCELAGCALIGGETAEMPGMYPEGEYDLAGFAVGVVEKSKIINGANVTPGDVLISLASSGAHANGYSLIRKIIEQTGIALDEPFEGELSLADILMTPTRIYVKSVLALMQKLEIKAIAHITGGGLIDNIPRILPADVVAEVDRKSWELPKLFQWLQHEGGIENAEMYRVFNCGVGMVLVVSASDAEEVLSFLRQQGEQACIIGGVRARQHDESQVVMSY